MTESEYSPPQSSRTFDRSFLKTWSACIKLIEMVLCVLCFLCNELAWHAFLPYPARTFLTVCACMVFIVTTLLFLSLGFRLDRVYSGSRWWPVVVAVLPATCGFFLVISSAIQLNIGGRVHAGFQAAAVFGFLAFSVFTADVLHQLHELHQAGQLPTVPAGITSRLDKLTAGADPQPGHDAERGRSPMLALNEPRVSPDRWSQNSGGGDGGVRGGGGGGVRGSYSLH